MKVFLCVTLMLLVTLNSITEIINSGKEVRVSEVRTRGYLTNAACVAIAVITIAFDVLLTYIIVAGI